LSLSAYVRLDTDVHDYIVRQVSEWLFTDTIAVNIFDN